MKFRQLNGFAFDRKTKAIGAIAGIDFIKQKVSILTDSDETVIVDLGTTAFLEQIGTINGVGVINGDVIETKDGKQYEIELQADGTLKTHLINERLERVESGESFPKEQLKVLAPYVSKVVGNINVLEPVLPTVDFNIKVVRANFFGEIGFFYACNNAQFDEVDLIKVVFVGHHLLEEEAYERLTLTHEEYLAEVEAGIVVETTPQALMNYVTGLTYGQTTSEEFAGEYAEEDDLEEEYEDDEEDNCDCFECRVARGEEDEEDYCEDDDCENEW
jgi:hypothetical protein